jgi:hypothetical protein
MWHGGGQRSEFLPVLRWKAGIRVQRLDQYERDCAAYKLMSVSERIDKCNTVSNGYPSGHEQIDKIKQQIDKLERKK